MDAVSPRLGSQPASVLTLLRWGRVAAVLVLILTALAWAGWATGIQELTRVYPTWPPMKPWTAVWLAALAVAILVQSGSPSPARSWIGRGLAAGVGVITIAVLVEYATGRTFGPDQVWFSEAVRQIQPVLPGRPSPQTVSSALLLSVPVALQRVNRPWTRVVWAVGLIAAMVMPFVTILGYLFGAGTRLQIASSTGMALTTAFSLLLIGAAIVLLRPAWMRARSDRLSLLRFGMILAGFPLLIGLTRRALLALSLRDDLSLTLATAVGTIVLGTAAYRLSRREYQLRETIDSDRTLLQANADSLVASERTYRLLAENVADVVYLVQDGKIAWVSPSVEQVSGAPPEYWVGRELREVIPPEDLAVSARRNATVLAGGVVKERARGITVDGVIHWVDVQAKPFYDSDGRQDGFVASLRVIDDEVAAQGEAEEARKLQARADERYRRSMDSAAVGMCLIAPDGRFVEVNDALCQLFGYDADTLIHKTWQELTVPDYLQADLRNFNDVLEGRQDSYRMLKEYIHADGHRIWGDMSVSCIRDQNGEVENFIAQIIDITAAVEAKERNSVLAQQLQQKSDRLATELESAASYMSSIMPRGLHGAVDVSSRYLPSRELGGDCFNYTWIDDDHLLVYLIDVSGHGLEPALLSVSVHNMLRSGSIDTQTLLAPEQVLAELNRLFQMDQQDEHYFTMWYGVYEMSSRTLRYANAGAPPGLVFDYSSGGTVSVSELSTTSPPIGMFEDSVFTAHDYAVRPGCQILIYSDGASEITLADDHQLRPAEFMKLIARVASSPEWSLDALINELGALSPLEAFEDDFSLIKMNFD